MTLDKRSDADTIVAHLRSLRSDDAIAGMGRFGIVTEDALGISNPVLQKIARQIGKNHVRAAALWRSGPREGRMLALYTFDPAALDAALARQLAADFNSWEIVDTAADLFVAAGLCHPLVAEFAADPREFVRRTAFAMIAGAAVHLIRAPDSEILHYLPLIEAHAEDPRNFVRKAVNWALRNIGKRSLSCHAPALALAERLAASMDRTAHWIGKDARRELTDPKILARLTA